MRDTWFARALEQSARETSKTFFTLSGKTVYEFDAEGEGGRGNGTGIFPLSSMSLRPPHFPLLGMQSISLLTGETDH